jgi:hypothetical protein
MALEQAGQLPVAEELYTEALARARNSDDATVMAQALLRLGGLLLMRGERAAADPLLAEAAATSEAIGCPVYVAEAHRQLAQRALEDRDLVLAGTRICTCLEAGGTQSTGLHKLWPLRVAPSAGRHRL